MYLTIAETAEYLSIKESHLKQMIAAKKIRAIYDGSQYFIYKEQFNTHFDQVEKYRKLILEYLNEPLPEDLDVKDED